VNIRASQTVVIAALGALAALILVAGVLLVVEPQRSHEHRLNEAVSAAQAKLDAARAPLATSAPGGKVDASDLFRLSEAMPDADRMPEILVGLSRLAAASSVQLASVRPAAEVPLQGYTALPIVVTVNGKYAAVTAFMHRLRESVAMPHGHLVVNGRLFVANQVALTSSDGRTITATVSLDAFDYVPLPPAAPVDSSGASTPTTTSGGTG
jgi:hypothetical protein